MKSFAKPPETIKNVMEIIMIALDYPKKEQNEWKNSLKLMANPTKLQTTLINYDFSKASPAMVKKVRTIIQSADNKLDVEAVSKVSSAAKDMMQWVYDWLSAAEANL